MDKLDKMRLKKAKKQEIKDSFHMMDFYDFKMDTSRLMDLDIQIAKAKNLNFAAAKNKLLASTEYWPQIQEMRKVENEPQNLKNGFKTKLNSLVEKALIEAINASPLTDEKIDKKGLNPYLNKLKEKRIKEDFHIQALQETMDLTIFRMELYLKQNYSGIYNWCMSVRGLNTKVIGKLIGTIGTIERFSNPSKLLTYCGIGDPETCKMKKGIQANYRPEMKALILGVMSDNFVMQRGQYRKIYDERKAFTQIKRPDWTPLHIERDAKRVMMKRFMMELWDAWYRSLGKEPPAQPYGVEIQGHHREKQIMEYEPYKK